jgi:hypothetical protein
MFTKLSDTNEVADFSVLVLVMALVATLAIGPLGITSGFGARPCTCSSLHKRR